MSVNLYANGPRRKLILMGAGASNLQLANRLFLEKISNLEITCIASEEQVLNPAMLPGLVAGQYSLAESSLDVRDTLNKFQVQWIQDKITAISTSNHSVQLHSGHTHAFDCLSINTAPLQHRDQIETVLPGAKKNGFFLYPMERFAHHWAQVCSDEASKALRITVIGGSMRSMEIALAVRQRLPHAAVTLVTQNVVQHASQPVADLLHHSLKMQGITLLHDTALECTANHVHLGCGARLACDIPIITLEPQAPAWLGNMHGQVYYWQLLQVQQGKQMLHAILGKEDKPGAPIKSRRINTYYSGKSSGIAQWGNYTLHGRMAGWFKNYKDRRPLNRS